MSVYPFELDSDNDIIRVDDNVTELGGEAIDQLRDAVFAIEGELGLGLSGSVGTLASRLNVSLNANGSIKQSALTAVGLVTLPISDNQIGVNAAIKESKLALDHSTSDLYTIITANRSLLNAVNAFATTTATDFLDHLAGSKFLSDGATPARHAASQIDLNIVPTDSRDPFYTWTGLKDKTGTLRTATEIATALLQINNDLVNHENETVGAHVATALTVDTSNFQEIPTTANTVQKVFDYLDEAEILNVGEHRAVQHAAGIPPVARSQSLTNPDGYGVDTVVQPTSVNTYLVNPPANMPVDSTTAGDDIVKFLPTNSGFVFDAQFSQVRVGDILRLNYGNGIEASFPIESIRYIPGSDWTVRINGSNFFEAIDGYIDGYVASAFARIDRARYDYNTAGVLALASANSIPNTLYPNILGSVIVGSPRGATALGLGFDGNQLNSDHYKLWLELYPTGNPADKVISLPSIDVTGDLGLSPGNYTLEKIVSTTNDAFRAAGYNYRFIAFDFNGDIGIMLADSIDNASFAIISGINNSGTLVPGTFDHNIIGDAVDDFDAFGMGATGGAIASPTYQSSFVDSTSAQLPTKIISPAKNRNYIVDGAKLDTFLPTFMANADGYWPAVITARVSTGASIEVTYKINLDLTASKLKSGKTIVVQPQVPLTSEFYSTNDYGRFIIKEVVFVEPCGSLGAFTQITVINGVHAVGNAIAFSSDPGLLVQIYFGEDSVGFNDLNVIDNGPTGINYHRYHEIYIGKKGNTFSHERARMKADQAETAPPTQLLQSNYWHIKSVSAKLQGYRDNNTTFNKYVRFYVTRYDSTSGEFDGYIGQRDPLSTNVGKVGPLTTSRKNITTRFYDETYIDYIDLEFKEINVGPSGTNILSNANARYVDIEIFPSLRLNKELLLIGSCEVNWHFLTNQNIIQSTRNLREFGSISAEDFTNSAKDFISAGDRLLHENGIFRGFSYISSSITTGELFFSGGVALVNGTIVNTNDSSVTIPQISSAGTVPSTVNWAICVNDHGYLVPIIVTPIKTQFFAQTTQYYIPSVTFNELINVRKDLTLIAMVTAHIASITINDSDVTDLRRFISNEGFNHPIVLSQTKNIGNFASFAAVSAWIKQSGQEYSLIRIRGDITVASTVDLTGFTKSVVIEGDGGIISVTAPKGFVIGNNVTFRNINFNYTPIGVTYATATSFVNSGNGCIYGNLTGTGVVAGETVNSSLTKITIERCVFDTSISGTQRPPYINFELNGYTAGAVSLSSVNIQNNRFHDGTSTGGASAIAIVNLNKLILGIATVLDIVIEGNHCSGDQTCIVTSMSDVAGNQQRLGLNSFNTTIRNNHFGAIGLLTSSVQNTTFITQNMAVIEGNRCKYIASLDGIGSLVSTNAVPYGTGAVIVKHNVCHWIHIFISDVSGTNEYSSTIIEGNILTANNSSILDTFVGAALGNGFNDAISVFSKFVLNEAPIVQILNNQIKAGYYGATYKYGVGVVVTTSAIVNDNIISDFGIGLTGFRNGTSTQPVKHIITNNQFFRNGATVFTYISISKATDSDSGIISENTFDSTTTDGTNTSVIAVPYMYTVTRNVNQIITTYIPATVGSVILGNIAGAQSVDASNTFVQIFPVASPNATTLEITYVTPNHQSPIFQWNVELNSIIPIGAIIIDVALTANTNHLFSALGSIGLSLSCSTPLISLVDNTSIDFTTGTALTFLTAKVIPVNSSSANTVKIIPSSIVTVSASGIFNDASNSDIGMTLQQIVVRYRF